MRTIRWCTGHTFALNPFGAAEIRRAAPMWLLFFTLTTQADIVPLALDVMGKISHFTAYTQKTYHLSETEILAMPRYTITTSTSWTPKSAFTGIRLSDLLKCVGATGKQIRVTTYDGYAYTIPVKDAEQYGVILAYERDGKRLVLRNFGPLFVVYPRDAHRAELTNSETESKFVWQVKSLEIR